MIIPNSRLNRFAADLIADCLVSRKERILRGMTYKNVLYTGDEGGDAAIFNKTYAYLDELSSLLYSPIGLRFNMDFYGAPSEVDRRKGRAAASYLHSQIRKSDSDTIVGDSVLWALAKGKTFVKSGWDRGTLSSQLVQPEMMGVLLENRNKLDESMEAFVHSWYITPHEFRRIIYAHPDRVELERKARKYMRPPKGDDPSQDDSMKQIIIGGLYPFQTADSASPNNTKGIVDWLGGPQPTLSPKVMQSMMRFDELWVWNDETRDWATFQMIGEDIMILGQDFVRNEFAWNPESKTTNEDLKGHHPFNEFCPNRTDGYFWGRSEIDNVALLQVAINSRINGINAILRKQEDPPTKFTGVSGINQLVLSRLQRPGGYFSDANPNAKADHIVPEVKQDLWASLHEYERMMEEMGGLPPIAKGRGEAGVRSQAHAESLIRMASPRFKDRAVLVERDLEALGGLALDILRAHDGGIHTAWVPKSLAGVEGSVPPADPLQQPPAPGLVPIDFYWDHIPDTCRVTVDSHSSSPIFAMEERALTFDLLRLGLMSPIEAAYHIDAPDTESLVADIERKEAQQAQVLQQHPELALKAISGGRKR